ncbi:GNAT family N-acetyltransferase [Dysgonomonas reticulitermitis]
MNILEANRLVLRELTEFDFAELCEILQDEEVMYAYEHAFSNEEVQDWLKLNQRKVYSIIRTNNFASQKVAEGVGMKVEKEVIKHYYKMDMLHYIYCIEKI